MILAASGGGSNTTSKELTGQTTSDAVTELFDANSSRFVLDVQMAMLFVANCVAYSPANNVAKTWQCYGTIQRNSSGVVALIGTVTEIIINESGSFLPNQTDNWDIAFTADNTNKALACTVQGETGVTINWQVSIAYFQNKA